MNLFHTFLTPDYFIVDPLNFIKISHIFIDMCILLRFYKFNHDDFPNIPGSNTGF